MIFDGSCFRRDAVNLFCNAFRDCESLAGPVSVGAALEHPQIGEDDRAFELLLFRSPISGQSEQQASAAAEWMPLS
jgi:hypothetical protein